jgi:hypothetical protein
MVCRNIQSTAIDIARPIKNDSLEFPDKLSGTIAGYLRKYCD